MFGAVQISISDMISALNNQIIGRQNTTINQNVFIQLRLPRVILCSITGAILSVSGVLMQGLFRNPIVEPGLVGTSSGAAFGASIIFVISSSFSPEFKSQIGPLLVSLFAFLGGFLFTLFVYTVSQATNKNSLINLLLIGLAVNAIGLSGTGFMSYIARDPQARSITFWNLGTFSGSSWFQVYMLGSVFIFCMYFALKYSKSLNLLILGESEADYLGVDTVNLKKKILLLNTIMVSIATSFVGIISFLGLIVPHLLRLLIKSDHKLLIPSSAILGAIILLIADLIARMLLAPAEIPIGILTSLVGAPIFIFLILKRETIQFKN